MGPFEDRLVLQSAPAFLRGCCLDASLFPLQAQGDLPRISMKSYLYRNKCANVKQTKFPEERNIYFVQMAVNHSSIQSESSPKELTSGLSLLFPVLAAMTIILLREIGNPSLGYPDADRILMDGVFILDFLKDFPVDRIYDYTVEYFGQYPALSIGYRPPFFPFIEALFNGALGINMWSSRLALLTFMMVGVTFWFLLVRRIYDELTAFAATLLLITTPFIAQWGWYTMAELPVLSMAMVTGYTFYRYTESDRPVYLYCAALLFGLTCWTKQTAAFLFLWFLLYIVFSGNLSAYLKRREVWIAILIALVLLAPLGAVTLWLGKLNIAQSIGAGERAAVTARLHWDNIKLLWIALYEYHLTLPVLILSITGILWGAVKKDRSLLYFVCLVLAVYLFFTYLTGKSARYSIFWIPAFTLFAALPVYYLGGVRPARLLAAFMLVFLAGYQVQKIYSRPVNYATGFGEAARYVLENSESPTVFYDGYNNGYFTYFMRELDPERSMYVLRADKLLTSSAITSNQWLEVHAKSRGDIQSILDDYGVQYVVVEERDISGLEIHRELRRLLGDDPFKLEKTISIDSTRPPLKNQKILIYRQLNRKPVTVDYLELRLPVVGQVIKVPMRKLQAVDSRQHQ